MLAALVGSRSGGPGPAPAPLPGTAGQPAVPGPASGTGAVAVQPAAQLPAAPAVAELPSVSVYLTKTGGIETLPLEQYVTGVLAAEMPADFELEALKAQAIAARTFIVRRLAEEDQSGVPIQGADVVDSVAHQAYLSSADLEKWPELGKGEQLAKLRQAVEQTKGIIMTYQGKPITATFFSASGGYTENSEEYWSLKLPYLRSVPSPWDKDVNPAFKETVSIPVNELFNKLGLKAPDLPAAASSADKPASLPALFQIKSYTAGHNIKTMLIGGHSFTGRELREKLGLRSAQFRMSLDGDDVKITTYGNGHGVGMSQWGAQGMAREGYTTTQILKHYYTGISFAQASALLKS
ncbi:stage II sporulation protein D [Paenibacillus ihumii]|uniref:stage II sporulation protein D n=1 Tax=Paenibacillus ihumii TaxID=687436 RepID=UPI0037097791